MRYRKFVLSLVTAIICIAALAPRLVGELSGAAHDDCGFPVGIQRLTSAADPIALELSDEQTLVALGVLRMAGLRQTEPSPERERLTRILGRAEKGAHCSQYALMYTRAVFDKVEFRVADMRHWLRKGAMNGHRLSMKSLSASLWDSAEPLAWVEARYWWALSAP